MSKRSVLLILCAVLLSLCLSGAAAEESRIVVWRVTAPVINAEALQTETFGTDLSAVQEEKREYDSLFWSLTGEGIPFCGIDHNRGAENMQARFDIYRHADAGEERTYYYNLDTWNAIPSESGFDAPRAAETLSEAQGLLERLGLVTDTVAPAPVSFSSLGRMEGTTPCRKVVYALTLEGLPVRWSAELLRDDGPTRPVILIDPCYVTVTYSDEDGLLMLEGNWCSFEPLTRSADVLSPEDALTRFRQAGLISTADGLSAPEACWLLSVSGQEATATLAWRVGNSYLSAVDGTWLQTEN
ncbi:MAG: hypothetical protein IKH77_05055 [Clostridia bacterium]|nr:hypothetical protein [Clostridia bacterium]